MRIASRDGQPLKRVVVAIGPDVLYVANPIYLDEIQRGRSQPIGFRRIDCFAWDKTAFETLSERYAAAEQTETEAWITLPPFTGAVLAMR
ncbi:hypothetical protein GOFOIKOB_4035 [Methylobacterium tardum]|uniref:Uncharacterized protein n=1 Tax=Methylobacterium tardum TaxID=374432 RepID=A0AA37TDZ2_9HYPH|nr:hypothetical protein [Methylobacterium tardum]URD38199.1 hypothetical protein M6G65_06990 [Methylobacterium tardum]GJE50981.1 hypothetical protein GOFOIKOB_4035 [Methylobacterium tardum]GLS69990.1 hypothetical protein GCM10007890_20030 [Methylobacterium tardum]